MTYSIAAFVLNHHNFRVGEDAFARQQKKQQHMTEAEFQEGVDNNSGYCINCKSVTGDYAEPDARNYECPECGKKTLFGWNKHYLKVTLT